MKAMILAAGQGTRLWPLTEHTPKCMVPIGGKPLLEHTIVWLREYGVTDLIINLHHLPHMVTDYFGDGQKWEVKITYSVEEEALGTAGGVKNVERFLVVSPSTPRLVSQSNHRTGPVEPFDGPFGSAVGEPVEPQGRPFFVWYGDNLSTCRLDQLCEFHGAKGGIATIALHYREDPTQSGIVDLNENDRVVRFLEKPQPDQVFSYWVSAGIFVLEPGVLDFIPTDRPSDFGQDIFPALLAAGQPLYGYRMAQDERLWWIDTLEDLQRVQRLADSGHQPSATCPELPP